MAESEELNGLSRQSLTEIKKLTDLVLFYQTKKLQIEHPNPLNRHGKKCFSQTDEDGITLEILKRLGKLDEGAYAEFGVGDGTENNTLILAALGWKGFWVGGEELAFRYKLSTKFLYLKSWITLDNILDLCARGMSHLNVNQLDVISLDLDGNDYYFVQKILSNNIHPRLFIVEYNAKFPPPVRFKIAYDADHVWRQDDYFGASLSSFVDLFSSYGYRLVCCNSHTGANAFFVSSDCVGLFSDVPTDVEKLYAEPRYVLYNSFGHKRSATVIEKIFETGE